ncbi:MAG TPA: hypothetical protein PLV45_08445 [bacterium]|nr:hypothetical protein [bacterium]
MSSGLRRTITAFAVWNIAVAVLWIWSYDGSMVHLRLEIEDHVHKLFCDGSLVDTFSVPAGRRPVTGRPGLGFSDASRAPLAVRPQEFDNFLVRDLSGKTTLLERRFDDLQGWFMIRGDFELSPRHRLTAERLAMGAAGDAAWSDYIIDVDCYNGTECFLLYRVADKNSYGRAKLRFWRELVVESSYYVDGQQTFHRIKSLAEPVSDGLKSLTLRFVKVYAVAVLILIAYLFLFIAVSGVLRPFLGTAEHSTDA